jgi:hypothetical protein
MDEITLSKSDLIRLFISEDIKDTQDGWLYQNKFLISIVALHSKDPKYIYDVTDAEYYKLIPIT